MNREDWLKYKRRSTGQRYDTKWAPIYDQNWGMNIDPTHERLLTKFLSLCPPQAHLLDAACGTGKYWRMILSTGRTVFGIDQSEGMLAHAREKFPTVPTEKVGLQEMHYQEAFDAAICMDAMEFVFPEDWLLVMNNLYRLIRPGGRLYFTVELADDKDIQAAFARSKQLGLPAVFGEWADEEGYHYYPQMDQVREWVQLAQFRLLEEAVGEDYHHFIVQKD
jgi:SAM-dependent methyltransferase